MADDNFKKSNGIGGSANNNQKPQGLGGLSNNNQKPQSSDGSASKVQKLKGAAEGVAEKVGSAYLQSQGVPKGLANLAVKQAKKGSPLQPKLALGGPLKGMLKGAFKGKADVNADIPVEQSSTFGGSTKFFKDLDLTQFLLLFFGGFLILFIFLVIVVTMIIEDEGGGLGDSPGYSSIVGGSYCTNIKITETGTEYSLEEYVYRVVSAEIGGDASGEGLKAQAVLARTFVLNETAATGNCEIVGTSKKQAVNTGTIADDIKKVVAETEGLVLTKGGKITGAYYASYPNGIDGSHNWCKDSKVQCPCGVVTCDQTTGLCTTRLYKYPSKTAWDFTMPSSFNNRTYNLQAQTGHCHGASQLGIAYYESLGENYSTILGHFYDDDVEISKLYTPGSDSVVINGTGQFKGKLFYYDQTDYSDVPFCGREIYPLGRNYCNKKGNSICSSGCGATSTAIVMASLFQDGSIDPIVINNKFAASNEVACGKNSDGTNGGAYSYIAKQYNVYYKPIPKSNLNCLKAAFDRGDVLAIIGVGEGTFTSRGHIMTVVGYKDGMFDILDPNGGDGTINPRNDACKTEDEKEDYRNGYCKQDVILGQMSSEFRLFSRNSLDTIAECK